MLRQIPRNNLNQPKNTSDIKSISDSISTFVSDIINDIENDKEYQPLFTTKKNSVKPFLNRIVNLDKINDEKKLKEAKEKQIQNINTIIELIKCNPDETLKELFHSNCSILFDITVNGVKKPTPDRKMELNYVLEKEIIKNPKLKKNMIKQSDILLNYYANQEKSCMISFEEIDGKIESRFDKEIDLKDVNEHRHKIQDKIFHDLLLIPILLRNNIITQQQLIKFLQIINKHYICIPEPEIIESNEIIQEGIILKNIMGKYLEIILYNLGIGDLTEKYMPDYKKNISKTLKYTSFLRYM